MTNEPRREGLVLPPRRALPLTRHEIRRIIEDDTEAQRNAASIGKNIYQMALDQGEAFNKRISQYTDQERLEIIQIYIEEKRAVTSHINNQTDRLIAKRVESVSVFYQVASAIALIITMMLVVRLFSR